jgi:formamidopyrimidine-DNA glycosylase
MLEYPEIMTISDQMKNELIGKTLTGGRIEKFCGNMFMNQSESEKYALLSGGKVICIDVSAPDIYIGLDNGFGILICQSGGKILYNRTEADTPKSYNIRFDFTDGGSLTYSMMLFTLGIYAISESDWNSRKLSNSSLKLNVTCSFNEYLSFISKNEDKAITPIKKYLAESVQGVMSTFAAEILLYAQVYPSTQLRKITREQHERIYAAMKKVLADACAKGGRTTERDLFGNHGKYTAMAERKNIGKPCPVCGTALVKFSTGGVTAGCENCQRKA